MWLPLRQAGRCIPKWWQSAGKIDERVFHSDLKTLCALLNFLDRGLDLIFRI